MKILSVTPQTVQEKSQYLIDEMVYWHDTLKTDPNSRFEAIKNIQDLLKKVDTFVRDELRGFSGSEQEQININAAAFPLREIILQTDPDLFMKDILSRKLHWGTANLAHDGTVAIQCAPFLMNRLPKIGFYGPRKYTFTPQNYTMRLHVAQAKNLPESLQRILAGRNPEKLDLISDYSLGGGILADDAMLHAKELRYNWVSHPWVFPSAQYGQDLKLFLEMGIFEPVGLREVQNDNGIPFNTLKLLAVHVHPQNGGTAISPNNAHFGISSEIPISAFWHAMLKDDKTIMVHQLISNIQDHPMTKLVNSALASPNPLTVQEHLNLLKLGRSNVVNRTIDRFDRIARAFEQGQPSIALDFFAGLDEEERKWVHFRIWQLKGQPIGAHSDFGRVSFEASIEVPAHYHATIQEKAQVLRELGAKQVAAFDQILDSHLALFNMPHDLPIPSAEYLRKKEAVQFLIEAVKADQDFIAPLMALKEADRQKLFAITWEIKGSPLGIHPDFGRLSFLADSTLGRFQKCNKQDRLNALYYFINNVD